MDYMLCYRCDQVYKTSRLICPSCRFVMVGVAVDDSGNVTVLRPAPPLIPRRRAAHREHR